MMQVVCQLQSTRTLENSQDFCFGPSQSVPIFLKFKPGPGATDFRGQARFRLQFRLERGGSMIHSSLQLQPNKSTAGVPVNLGRAGPRWRPSLVEDRGWGGGASQSQDLGPIFSVGLLSCATWGSPECQAAILGSPAGRPGIQTSDSDRDVVAGVGGAAGPAPDVRHQPEGTTPHRLQL